MDSSLSMNTMSGHLDLKHLERREKLYAAQRSSQPLTFHPKDGSAPLRAWALNEVGDGWWDIIVDNQSVEEGTTHRVFETRSRMAGPLDTDVRGLFSVGVPPHLRDGLPDEQAIRNQADFAAYAQHRIGQNAKISEAMGGGILGLAQQIRAPGKMFSRETITGVLRGRRADAEMDCPGSPRSNELAYLIRIFENLE